jgi:hypothetical protein
LLKDSRRKRYAKLRAPPNLQEKKGEKRQKGGTVLKEAVKRLNQQYAMAGFWQLSFGMSVKITVKVEKSGSWFHGLNGNLRGDKPKRA